MALELLIKNDNFFEYTLCANRPAPTGFPALTSEHGLCSGSKIYFETISTIQSFVYNAATDRYWLTTINFIANWPGSSVYTSIIHPETGEILSRTLIGLVSLPLADTSTAYNGGLNKMYAGFFFGPYKVVEVSTITGTPTAYQIANPVVTPTQIATLGATNFGLMVCPERKLITILSDISTEGIVVYDYSPYPSAGIRKWSHPFPERYAWSAGYEDDERIWGLFSGSNFGSPNNVNQTLLKYNYAYNKIELLTELQINVAPDREARICFDTKRKKLAAVRVKADLTNGQGVNAFEIYAPRPAMTRVTVPVAITRLSPNQKVAFRSHLLGTKAEAGGMRILSVSNVEVDGTIIKDEVPTDAGGTAQFEYTTATAGLTDTLTVEYNETKVIV